eukprot:11171598-Lingulodinium_polyedra.AAC.1
MAIFRAQKAGKKQRHATERRQARVVIHESAEEKTGSGCQECVRDACDAQKYCGLAGHEASESFKRVHQAFRGKDCKH